MGYEFAVVSLLESPTRQAVEALSVSCAITSAARGFFSDRHAMEWFDE